VGSSPPPWAPGLAAPATPTRQQVCRLHEHESLDELIAQLRLSRAAGRAAAVFDLDQP
jgi:hypothetical protein